MNHLNPSFENTNEYSEYEANKVLAEIGWNGEIPIDPLEICEMYGIEYIFAEEPSMQEEGTTKFCGEGDFHIVMNTHGKDCIDSFSENQTIRRRQRFTLAHELAHCIFKSHTNLQLQKNLSNKKNPHSKNYIKTREGQANLFAANILVPRKAFKFFSRKVGWNNIFNLISQTSEKFDVSLEVAAQQIARFANYPCITILFSGNKIPKRVPSYSDDFLETKLFYPRNQDAPQGTAVEKILSKSNQKQCIKKHYTDASTWFPNQPEWRVEKFSIDETSIKNGKYGAVTFLEIFEIEN